MLSKIKYWLIGDPLPTHQLKEKRLNKVRALAAFSPDALSSIAYANQEIYLGLIVAGGAALALSWPIGVAITGLLIIVARDFAGKYAQTADVRRAAEALLREGPRLVAITDGVRGSWVCSQEGEFFHQPAYLLPDVVDTTGCGDSYHGAFLFGLLQGWDLRRTAALASAVAALNSQHLGGRGGLPTLAQAEAFLAGAAC